MFCCTGENPVLHQLYEQEGEAELLEEEEGGELSFNNVYALKDLWCYKSRISLQDVTNKLDEYRGQRKGLKRGKKQTSDPDNCDILYDFLNQVTKPNRCQ